jgi:tetratricopeptide (TPR) repeat protein
MSVTALLLMSLPLSQSAISDITRAEQERLNACIERTVTNPTEAYEDSLAWLSSGNRPKARYCNAIALLALEEFEEGAARLEALATAPDAISISDRALYMTQAGNAWLTAGYPDAAITSLSEAIKISPRDPSTRKDRAAAYLMVERWFEAVDDLNMSLELVPTDGEALSLRARAHLATENLPAAKADMEEALVYDPTNLDILVLRGEIREAIRLSRLGR